jgi:hypothetical protein
MRANSPLFVAGNDEAKLRRFGHFFSVNLCNFIADFAGGGEARFAGNRPRGRTPEDINGTVS